MAKDLKHRVKAIRDQNPRRPDPLPRVGLVLIGGFLLLALVAAGYLRREGMPLAEAPPVEPPPAPAPAPPQFGYFMLLPEGERQLPEAEIGRENRETRLGRAPTEGRYFLQIGSFREPGEAEQRRRQVEAFGKLRPRLEKIQFEYSTWYRLRLGPYRTLPDADQVRQFLRSRDIDSILQTPVAGASDVPP